MSFSQLRSAVRTCVGVGVRGYLVRCAVVLGMLFCAQAPAQAAPAAAPAPFVAVDQLQRTLFTSRDGAPQGVYALTQDKDGYLWLGGSNGLYRFDGIHFERMYEAQLPPVLITAIFFDAKGDLWIGNLRGGLFRAHQGVVADMNTGTARSTPMSFTAGPGGSVWMGTAGGVFALSGTQRTEVPVSAHEPAGERNFVNLYGTGWDGSYWAFAGRAAYRHRPGSIGFEESTADEGMAALAGLPGGVTYSSSTVVADMVVDRYRALWVPTSDGLLRMHAVTAPQGTRVVTEQVHFSDGEDVDATADFVDRDGNIWIASERGLEQFRATRFTPVTLPAAVRRPTLAADDRGAMWIASRSSLPPMRVTGAASSVTPHPELGVNVVCLARSPDGRVWLSADDSIHAWKAGVVTTIPLPPAPADTDPGKAPGRHCAGLAAGAVGTLWMQLYGKVWHWDSHQWSPGYDKQAFSMAVDGERAWLGRPNGTLVLLGGEDPQQYTRDDGLNIGALVALSLGKSGLWLGGSDGLMIKRGEHFQRITGLHGERYAGVVDVLQLPDGQLWVLAARGLYRISATEVEAALRNPQHVADDTLFDQEDGLRGALGALQSDPLELATDGRLWVASDRGVAWVDPAGVAPAPQAPVVSLLSLNGTDLVNAAGQGGALAAGTRSVDIAFTAATLTAARRVQFRYTLQGVDEHWQDAGTQRRAHYANLGPGHYVFRVQASDTDGQWNTAPSTLSFRIQPLFYQTWWFRLGCLLALVLVGWALYRRHLSRIFAAHQARLHERERIARELHDSLLQHFQALLLYAHSASTLVEGAARDRFTKVVDIAEDALVEGRERIMGLRSVSESLEALPADIRKLEDLLGGLHGMTLTVGVVGEPRPLQHAVADEVHAIAHELVANAFRHSKGSQVHLELRYERQALVAIVTDDGEGIGTRATAATAEGRWGIAGMRERARQVGGVLTLDTRDTGGTRATLRVPARVAYRWRWK